MTGNLAEIKSRQNLRLELKHLSAAVVFAIVLSSACLAQQPSRPASPPRPTPSTQPSEEAKLIDGLLDLLNEPAPELPTAGDKSDATGQPAQIDIQPADVGLDGEDLGEEQGNPLKAIRQSMFIAAGYLERGVTSMDTQTIQQDIVQRLDELIAEVEKPDPEDNQSQASQQKQSASQQQQQQSSASQPAAAAPPANSIEANEGGAGEMESSGPGNRGDSAQAMLELSDPVSLQQSLWGQLPQRVRKQMQSQMVERFLPSYRDQIEAYFQALLRQQED